MFDLGLGDSCSTSLLAVSQAVIATSRYPQPTSSGPHAEDAIAAAGLRTTCATDPLVAALAREGVPWHPLVCLGGRWRGP